MEVGSEGLKPLGELQTGKKRSKGEWKVTKEKWSLACS